MRTGTPNGSVLQSLPGSSPWTKVYPGELNGLSFSEASSLASLRFTAIQLVLQARQPLTAEELFDAVIWLPRSCTVNDEPVDWSKRLADGRALLDVCSQTLTVNTDKKVVLCSSGLPLDEIEAQWSLSSTFSKNMATVCLQRVIEVDARALLAPEQYKGAFLETCRHRPFTGYSYRNWHDHFRSAETVDNDLPPLLYEGVEKALEADPCLRSASRMERHKAVLTELLSLGKSHQFDGLTTYCYRSGAETRSARPSPSHSPSRCTLNSATRLPASTSSPSGRADSDTNCQLLVPQTGDCKDPLYRTELSQVREVSKLSSPATPRKRTAERWCCESREKRRRQLELPDHELLPAFLTPEKQEFSPIRAGKKSNDCVFPISPYRSCGDEYDWSSSPTDQWIH